jgi:hypothetical protein
MSNATQRQAAAPSDKQIRFAMHLLAANGYSTRYMNASFKALGATMRERSGTVEGWLAGMDRRQISSLIDRLKTSD